MQSRRGFTLVEIVVILLILGLMSLWVIPQLSGLQMRDIRWTARRLGGIVRSLANEATMTRKHFRLHYDMDRARYWAAVREETGMYAPLQRGAFSFTEEILPDGVAFEDIVTVHEGKVTHGETFTQIDPSYVEKTWIHLRSENEFWSLEVHPFTGRVKVRDRYVEAALP